MKRIILDCDNTIGIKGRPMDDALALLYLLGRSDACEVVGICCNFGNGTVAEIVECTNRQLKEIGMEDIPVYSGSERGQDPISNASRFIVDVTNRYAGDIYYLGIGSLGNLYGAYELDHDVYNRISQIVLMGGITEPLFIHDHQPLAELNFSVFAEASVNVLTHGHNISIITGNNCLPVAELPKDEFLSKLCTDNNATGMYIAQSCGYRFKDKEVVYGAVTSYCWDAVAAAYMLEPQLFIDKEYYCHIDLDGINWGFLKPGSLKDSNVTLNIPSAISKESLQNEIYKGWLSLNIDTENTHYSCNGLYLDKLIQPAILIELRDSGPAHGFKLLNSLKAKGLIEESVDQTGFYRTLKRMERDSLLSSEKKEGSTRREFYITGFGKQCLANWKTSLVEYKDHISELIELI